MNSNSYKSNFILLNFLINMLRKLTQRKKERQNIKQKLKYSNITHNHIKIACNFIKKPITTFPFIDHTSKLVKAFTFLFMLLHIKDI